MSNVPEVVYAIRSVTIAMMVIYFVGFVIWNANGYIAIAVLIVVGAFAAHVNWDEHFAGNK